MVMTFRHGKSGMMYRSSGMSGLSVIGFILSIPFMLINVLIKAIFKTNKQIK